MGEGGAGKSPGHSGRETQYAAGSLAIQAGSPQHATLHSTAVPGALDGEASIGRAHQSSPRPRTTDEAHGSGARGRNAEPSSRYNGARGTGFGSTPGAADDRLPSSH